MMAQKAWEPRRQRQRDRRQSNGGCASPFWLWVYFVGPVSLVGIVFVSLANSGQGESEKSNEKKDRVLTRLGAALLVIALAATLMTCIFLCCCSETNISGERPHANGAMEQDSDEDSSSQVEGGSSPDGTAERSNDLMQIKEEGRSNIE